MTRTIRRALLFLLLACVPAAAEDPSAAARAVVERQIEAFLADDAETAYGLASPSIRAIYPDLNRFMAMVKRGYAPVYRPGNYAFGRTGTDPKGFVHQEVLIAGPDGGDWTALYLLEPQPDGSLKIAGVRLYPTAPRGI